MALLPVLGVLACSHVSSADPVAPPPAGDFRYQKVVAPGAKVEVRNVNGAVSVEETSGEAVEVVATKSGRASDFGRVQIVTREEGGTLLFCAVWPGQSPDDCRVDGRRGGAGSTGDADVKVDFHIKVPAKVAALTALTANGAVKAKGVHGTATCRTANGRVEVEATGAIVAESANGEVVARAAAGQPATLRTANGAVTVLLPGGAAADVDAATTNGRISSEFGEVPAPTLPALHAARFKIGGGGAAITLHTTNGGIQVKRL